MNLHVGLKTRLNSDLQIKLEEVVTSMLIVEQWLIAKYILTLSDPVGGGVGHPQQWNN